MSMSPDSRVVTVHYERKFSDGNYGSEGLSMTWTATFDLTEYTLAALAKVLRTAVLSELAASANSAVARAAKHELAPAPPPDPNAEAWAHSNAAAEERAIRTDEDDDREDIQPGDYHYYNPR